MIKSLAIQNFQSHEHTKLDFSPGVNIIVGSSDSGKTAIIRALRWIVWNRPSGEEMRSWWGGTTFCILETEEGYVLRFKDKQDKYELKLNGGKDVVFKAIGTGVPEEIQNFLNVSEINLQMQLDSPFLLSNTPGEVAKHFNKIARLYKIDDGIQNVNKLIRETENLIKYRSDFLEGEKQRLLQFEYLDKAEIELEILEDMDKQLSTERKRYKELSSLIQKLRDLEEESLEVEKELKYEKEVDKLIKLYEKIREYEDKYDKLGLLADELENLQESLEKAEQLIPYEKQVNSLLELYSKKKTLEENNLQLYKLRLRLYNIENLLDAEMSNLHRLEVDLEEMLPEGSICPLCNQIIKKEEL